MLPWLRPLDTGHDEPPVNPADEIRFYTVRFGWCRENWDTLPTFAAALAFYRLHRNDGQGAKIFSADADDEGDGLSAEEKDAIEAADADDDGCLLPDLPGFGPSHEEYEP